MLRAARLGISIIKRHLKKSIPNYFSFISLGLAQLQNSLFQAFAEVVAVVTFVVVDVVVFYVVSAFVVVNFIVAANVVGSFAVVAIILCTNCANSAGP